MKKRWLMLCIIVHFYGINAQSTNDFQTRFGPNSIIYNQPLYFSTKQMKQQQLPSKLTHRKYHDRIRRKIKNNRKR